MIQLLESLSSVLNINIDLLKKKIDPKMWNVFRPVEIKASASFEMVSFIAENIEKYPGIYWTNKPVRRYLETGSVSHAIGYVGDINKLELQVLYNKGYKSQDVIGKSGIEKQYDELLRGKDGYSYKTVDVKGKSIKKTDNEDVLPVPGKSLVLSIDRRIQKLAEKSLGERIGSVVVLKPATGEVLALVSYPYYDPNTFYSENNRESFTALSLDSNFPFLNRAIQSSYAPASVFKIIMTTAILEEEAFPKDKKITCYGKIQVGDRAFNCHKKTGHGPLKLSEALAESCDVYYYTVGREHLGPETISEYAKRFGLGAITGIDLPGEVAGVVPSPKWKEKTYNSRWAGGDTVNMSIGQGFTTVTPLQTANYVAMVVNDGVIYKPQLLLETRDFITGKTETSVQKEVLHRSTIRKETFDEVKKYMRGVITDGTAKWVVTTKAVEVAGKTGTGEVGFDDRWTSWFAAYAPYETDDPFERVVVVTMIEAVNDWEWWAPKAANIIFQGIFANQTYEEAVKALKLWYIKL
jgi:penicillin-binding protein 2